MWRTASRTHDSPKTCADSVSPPPAELHYPGRGNRSAIPTRTDRLQRGARSAERLMICSSVKLDFLITPPFVTSVIFAPHSRLITVLTNGCCESLEPSRLRPRRAHTHRLSELFRNVR